MKDFLGNEFDVGALIVYAKGSGRSVCLVKGRVLKFNENGSVQIQPEMESWSGGRERSGTTRYIDTRTGKGFDPYSDKNVEHMVRPYGYVHKETGDWISYDEYHVLHGEPRRGMWRSPEQEKYTSASVIWKDYVKIENKVKPVTITRTDNIILVPGG